MQKFSDALKHGFEGIAYSVKTQRNFRYQLIIFCIVIIASWFFQLTFTEFAVILALSALVLSMEIMNTAVEKTVDTFTQGKRHESAKIAKDAAAGAVVMAALFSIVVGIIIFLPHIMRLIK